MPSLILTTAGTRATLVSDRLRIEMPADDDGHCATRDVHLHDIEQVTLSESATLTIPALAELMRREIPVYLTGSGDRILGLCHPPGPHSRARLEQYRRASDAAFTLAMACSLVEAKILNSRRVLQRLASNRDFVEVTPLLLALKGLADQAARARSVETLRGLEGTAAGQYFEAYGSFFPDHAPLERRSRRPPHNAVNAILSFCYTILASEAEAALHATGLDPCIGFYHEPEDRRASLALDLIEPFRAPVADAMALDLISHETLHPKHHFESRSGGVYLNPEGRKRFFVAYERRMERPFTSEQTGRKTTLRDQLQNQALKIRQTVSDGAVFEPFLMN